MRSMNGELQNHVYPVLLSLKNRIHNTAKIVKLHQPEQVRNLIILQRYSKVVFSANLIFFPIVAIHRWSSNLNSSKDLNLYSFMLVMLPYSNLRFFLRSLSPGGLNGILYVPTGSFNIL
eukprot:UN28590